VLAAVVAVGVFYYVLPRLVGLGPTLRRLRTGDVWWLALGVLFEAVSLLGQSTLLRGVFSTPDRRIGLKTSSQIALAGAAATKVLAAAGAGGIILTVWALRGLGVPTADVASGMVCYEVIVYGVYMLAVVIAGLGLWTGLFSGGAPVGLTLVPAIFAAAVIVIVVSMLFIDEPAERFLLRRAERSKGKLSRWLRRAAALPRSLHAGLLAAIAMFKRRDPSVLGALAYWAFDIGTLWASFRAFGHSPPGAVLVMGYFLGTLGSALPLPGGIGGVEGAMIAAFIAFGVSSHVAVLAVLGYRTISYWLPTIPGAIAYFRLLRRLDSREPAPD
jgi:putative heme transporter